MGVIQPGQMRLLDGDITLWNGFQWVRLFDILGLKGRNLLHNGQMAVCQRATSLALINTVNGVRVCDRWWMLLDADNTGAIWTISQETDSPPGFARSQKWLCTQVATPLADDYATQRQAIEGQNLQHLLWGTANAKPLTLSFWVKSNKTGTYIAEIYLSGTVLCSAAYTISASGVWEYKTLTFPGNTSVAITADANAGLFLQFWLVVGSTYGGGASLQTAWGSTANKRAFGQVNLASNVNNYWQSTGVQLEVGSVATPFEVRPYADELRDCQRYYEQTGYILNTTITTYWSGYWKVTKRAVPTITFVAQGGTGAMVVEFAGMGANEGLQGFYQSAAHSLPSNSLVIGNAEI